MNAKGWLFILFSRIIFGDVNGEPRRGTSEFREMLGVAIHDNIRDSVYAGLLLRKAKK